MLPLGAVFSYFSVAPLTEEDVRQYLSEPLAALPPRLCQELPKTGILLAPYLEKGNGKSGDAVVFEKPGESRRLFGARVAQKDSVTLVFAIKDDDLADYHYTLYGAIAREIAGRDDSPQFKRFREQIREELAAEVHGEVDERSWHLKQALLRRQKNVKQETKQFREYVHQALEDTLTLFLHGICCDIDVEPGPRQMPSRYLRKRLELLASIYPPPEGYSVLPEHPKKR